MKRTRRRASPSRKKTATNLSLRADLVTRAKALGLNLSEVCETALASAIRKQEQAAWLEENRASIDAYNAAVENRGLFSDDWRTF
jgi:antitoxin CcdA